MMEYPHERGEGRTFSDPATSEHSLVPAERVNGTPVFNTRGEKLGKVEDVAIDKRSGQVAYAILSFGGFLGIGERYHPLPWRLLDYHPDRGGFVIPCDKEELEKAPSFEPHELSGWNDGADRERIYSYYARHPLQE